LHNTKTKDRKIILAVEKSYDDAWDQGEAKILASFFTHDAIIINPTVLLKSNENYSFVEMKDLTNGERYW